MKSHCLRPLPPADPAPARPLGGICLGGGGGFQPGNRPRSPPSHFCPGEGLPHLSPSPLLPPTAARENSCLRGTDRAVRTAAVPASPPRTQEGTATLTPGGDSEEGRGEVTAHDPPGTLSCYDPDGSDGRPLVPNSLHFAPLPLAFQDFALRIYGPLPLGEGYRLQSFLFFCLFFGFETRSHTVQIAQAGFEYIMWQRLVLNSEWSTCTTQVQICTTMSGSPAAF